MKSKKGIIILSTVVVACAVGFIVSPLVNWSVDESNASGDIAKSSRFSRKTAAESLTNMEELLANDEDYKNNISAVYVVMQTRALQFASLVDMSNEVAGGIPAFAGVLKDMSAAREMVNNVNLSLAEAGADLNAALSGESRPDLTQNTINASLAYTTLQKQNKLATRFIETTDKYLETAEGDNRLKFVRDQWFEYQQVTAALEGDEKAAEMLNRKGTLLSGEEAVSELSTFGYGAQVTLLAGSELASDLAVDNKLSDAFTMNGISDICTLLSDVTKDVIQGSETSDISLQDSEVLNTALSDATRVILQRTNLDALQNANLDALQNVNLDALQNANLDALQNANLDALQDAATPRKARRHSENLDMMNAQNREIISNQNRNVIANQDRDNIILQMSNFDRVIISFQGAMDGVNINALNSVDRQVICQHVGDAIADISLGNLERVDVLGTK